MLHFCVIYMNINMPLLIIYHDCFFKECIKPVKVEKKPGGRTGAIKIGDDGGYMEIQEVRGLVLIHSELHCENFFINFLFFIFLLTEHHAVQLSKTSILVVLQYLVLVNIVISIHI